MNPLNLLLSKSGILGEEPIHLLLKAWQKTKKLKPKETLLSFNREENYLYFVESGCVRLFVKDQENEINIGFGYQNSMITAFQSFIQDKPSLVSIQAILPTELICIHKSELRNLIGQHIDIAHWYESLLERTLSGHIQRQIELLTLSPQEKYETFIQRSGHLVNTIPSKHIASYLMMTPETLSRVRAKIS